MNRGRVSSGWNAQHGPEVALQELQDRIEASCLESAYAGMVCDMCVGQMSLRQAYEEVQQKAMEQMVGLLDARILEDEAALEACLERIAAESERVAWQALEKGTEAVREGLAVLQNLETIQLGEFLN